nr:hypothetical protein [Cytophagales bacterium]
MMNLTKWACVQSIGFLMTALSYFASAQSYGTAAGLRLGNSQDFRTLGLTAKQRLVKGITAEAIVQSDFTYNTTAHVLLARHRPFISRRFNYFYGGGISAGMVTSQERVPESAQLITTYGNPALGVDFILGVEMTLLKLNVSLDYKPNINLIGIRPWYGGQVGISVRPVFVKGKEQQKRQRQRDRMKRKSRKDASPGRFNRFLELIKKQ